MRYLVLVALCTLLALPGCKDDEEAKKPKPPEPPPVVANPPKVSKTRENTNDIKLIQGKWQSGGRDDPMQFEFAGDKLIIRTGPNWQQVAEHSFKLTENVNPPLIDWGQGATAGAGLYTIDGKTLILTYAPGGPENRPAKIELKKPPIKQLYLTKVE